MIATYPFIEIPRFSSDTFLGELFFDNMSSTKKQESNTDSSISKDKAAKIAYLLLLLISFIAGSLNWFYFHKRTQALTNPKFQPLFYAFMVLV